MSKDDLRERISLIGIRIIEDAQKPKHRQRAAYDAEKFVVAIEKLINEARIDELTGLESEKHSDFTKGVLRERIAELEKEL